MPNDLESGDTLAAPAATPVSAPGSVPASASGSTDETLPAAASPSSADGSGDPTMPGTGGRPAAEVGLRTVDPDLYAERVEITRGGMGRIIAARDRRLGRRVAIKELRDPGEGLRARFEREALLTARLQHPAIVSVHEAGRWPSGEPFIAMKLVPGVALDKVIARAKTFDERLALLPHILAVADALAYAHQQRVVHRDLKPANVLVGDFGETVVIDWGLAKDLADIGGDNESGGPYRTSGDGTETAVGSVLGTPAYMPLEQAHGQAVDERADVYAIGAMLYHVLCGSAPYEGKDAADVLAAVIKGPPRPLAERQPGLPPDLDALVTRAMAREPAERYPTAKELADDLRRFQTGQLVGAHRYSRRQLLWRWVKRHSAAVVVATIAVVIVAVLAAVSLSRIFAEQRRTEEQRVAAEWSRGEAEELLQFMLFELRRKLKPLARLDIIDPIATKADEYYQRNRNTGDPDEQERRGALAQTLGDVRKDQGKLAEALLYYRASLIVSLQLLALSPGQVDHRFNVAVDHSRIGEILHQQGELDGALASFRSDLAIIDRLLAENPPEPKWERERTSVRQRIAETLMDRGQSAEALAEQREVLALRQAIVRRQPDDADAQFDLAITHGRLAQMLEELGDPDGALREYRSEIELADRGAAANPSSAAWQSLVSSSRDNMGDVLLEQGDITGARDAYLAGIDNDKRRVAQDPDHVGRQRNLAVKHLKIGEVLDIQGDATAALTETRAARAIFQRLADRDPTSADRQRDVAVAHTRLADLLLKSGDHAGAIELLRASLAIRSRLVALDTDNVDRQRDYSAGLDRLGKALKVKGDLRGALVQYRAALDLTLRLAARDPDNARWQADLAISYGKIGEVLLKQKEPKGALEALRSSLDIRKRLLAREPGNRDWQRDVASAHGWVGDALRAAGDRAGAGAAYAESLALFEPLAAGSSNPNWKAEAAGIRSIAMACCRAYIKEAGAKAAPQPPP